MEAGWIGVGMAFVAMVGVAIERIVNMMNLREKTRCDKELTIKQAEIAANTQALENRVNRQALQIKACDSAHTLTQRELEEVKIQNGDQERKLKECEEQHKSTENVLLESKKSREELTKRIEKLEDKLSDNVDPEPTKGQHKPGDVNYR